jgi:hypothetical protein
MANITITVPDDQVNRILDGIAGAYRYNPATHGTKAQFARAVIARFVKETVKGYEAQTAGETARAAAETSADTTLDVS